MKKPNKEYEKLKDRYNKLSIEISHGNYYDGWTLNGMKEELLRIEHKLEEFKNQEDGKV